MRYRVENYEVKVYSGGVILTIPVPDKPWAKIEDWDSDDFDSKIVKYVTESLRVVIDETAHVALCSSMLKDRLYHAQIPQVAEPGQTIELTILLPAGALVTSTDESSVTYRRTKLDGTIEIKTISITDQFTIAFDWGDEPAGLSGGGGNELEPATDAEYAAFKTHMQTEIANILTPITEE